MAGTIPGRISARFKDANGNKAVATAYVKLLGTATVSTICTDLQAWGTALNGVSDAEITELAVVALPTGAPIGTVPTNFDDSDVIETLGVVYKVTGLNRVWTFTVPACADDIVNDGKITLADLSTLNGLMGTNTNYDAYSNTYQALGAMERAFHTGRKHHNYRLKSTSYA